MSMPQAKIAGDTAADTAPHAPADAPADVSFERVSDEELRVTLGGTWHLGAPRPDPAALERELRDRPAARVTFDSTRLGTWDTALLAWLRAVMQGGQGDRFDRSGLPSGVVEMLDLAERVVEPPRAREAARPPFLARVGARASRAADTWVETLAFLGRVTQSIGRLLTFRAQFRRVDLVQDLQAAGADAVPIVTLLSLIVGLILAFVGAVQLRLFGADLYVADLVGIAMVREMGAMIVGIILAGRTGAAYAAQLGTMKVTEEIDALTTFGISVVDFLVLPRVVALFLMTPFLCLYAIVLGCLGGALVGVGMLGLSPRLYLDQTLRAVELSDLYGGVFRSAVYGLLVGLIGCLRGMRCGNDAAAVGEATTGAVVTALVAIVVADGILAVVFNVLGI
jgi:phospholipid/cholesterol/gamma-HCH transport system permease protein